MLDLSYESAKKEAYRDPMLWVEQFFNFFEGGLWFLFYAFAGLFLVDFVLILGFVLSAPDLYSLSYPELRQVLMKITQIASLISAGGVLLLSPKKVRNVFKARAVDRVDRLNKIKHDAEFINALIDKRLKEKGLLKENQEG